MAKPITDDEKARIVELIDQGETRNAIAREVGRSASTITAIANEHDRSFDRSATKHATAALAADNDARRELMMAQWLNRHEREQERLAALDAGDGYRLVKATGSGKVIDEMVTTAPEEDRQRIYTAAAICVDKVKVLHSMRANRTEGKSMLEELFDGLAEAVG